MKELEFGVPSQRLRKEDPYKGQDVLVIHERPAKKGKSTRFELSDQIVEKMGFNDDNNIAVSFVEDRIFLANVATGTPASLNLTQANSFSNAKIFNYITGRYSLDDTKMHVLPVELVDSTDIANVNSLVEVIIKETAEDNVEENATVEDTATDQAIEMEDISNDHDGDSVFEERAERPITSEEASPIA